MQTPCRKRVDPATAHRVMTLVSYRKRKGSTVFTQQFDKQSRCKRMFATTLVATVRRADVGRLASGESSSLTCQSSQPLELRNSSVIFSRVGYPFYSPDRTALKRSYSRTI